MIENKHNKIMFAWVDNKLIINDTKSDALNYDEWLQTDCTNLNCGYISAGVIQLYSRSNGLAEVSLADLQELAKRSQENFDYPNIKICNASRDNSAQVIQLFSFVEKSTYIECCGMGSKAMFLLRNGKLSVSRFYTGDFGCYTWLYNEHQLSDEELNETVCGYITANSIQFGKGPDVTAIDFNQISVADFITILSNTAYADVAVYNGPFIVNSEEVPPILYVSRRY